MEFVKCKSTEIRQQLKEKCVILPVGSIEQHGPHLPLHVDMLLAEHIAQIVAEKTDNVVMPVIPILCRSFSFSGGGNEFDGNIYVTASTATQYMKDILLSLIRNGAKKVLIINGHYENESPIFEAIEQLRDEARLECDTIVALSWWSAAEESFIQDLFPGKFNGWHAEHASIVETSMVMAIDRQLVNNTRIDNENPPTNSLLVVCNRDVPQSCFGVLNKTSGSSIGAGLQIIEHVVSNIIQIYREKFV